MGRKVILGSVAAAACLAVTLWVVPATGIIDSTILFRSARDLESLRALLADSAIRAELNSLCENMSLCEVNTDSVPARPSESCATETGQPGPGERTRHKFVFASTVENTSRAYAVGYTTCKRAPGSFRMELERQGFETRRQHDAPPVLVDSQSLFILSKALDDENVSSSLLDTLRNRHITFSRVLFQGPSEEPGVLKFLFLAAGEAMAPDEGTLIQFDVEYSPGTGEVYFTRIAN
jgi:hypothetical protein